MGSRRGGPRECPIPPGCCRGARPLRGVTPRTEAESALLEVPLSSRPVGRIIMCEPMVELPVLDSHRFRILHPLDRGGISRVYVAYDEELNRMAMRPRTATSRQSTWVTTSRAGSPRGRSRPDRPPLRGTGWPIQRSGAAKKKVVTVRPMPGSISMRSVTKGEIFSAAPTQGRLRTPGGGTRPGSPHISRG